MLRMKSRDCRQNKGSFLKSEALLIFKHNTHFLKKPYKLPGNIQGILHTCDIKAEKGCKVLQKVLKNMWQLAATNMKDVFAEIMEY